MSQHSSLSPYGSNNGVNCIPDPTPAGPSQRGVINLTTLHDFIPFGKLFPLRSNSKKPMAGWKNWPSRASDDPVVLADWLEKYPDSNWALIPTRCLVLDVDTKVSKDGVFRDGQKFLKQYEDLPETLMIATPSGGRHYYFQQSRLGPVRKDLVKAVEVRANDGCYVVLPYSRTPEGSYRIIHGDVMDTLAKTPEWMEDLLAAKVKGPTPGTQNYREGHGTAPPILKPATQACRYTQNPTFSSALPNSASAATSGIPQQVLYRFLKRTDRQLVWNKKPNRRMRDTSNSGFLYQLAFGFAVCGATPAQIITAHEAWCERHHVPINMPRFTQQILPKALRKAQPYIDNWISRQPKRKRHGTSRDQILAALRNGPHSATELAKVIGLARATVCEHLQALTEAGLIDRSAFRYFLPTAPALTPVTQQEPESDRTPPAPPHPATRPAGAPASTSATASPSPPTPSTAAEAVAPEDEWPEVSAPGEACESGSATALSHLAAGRSSQTSATGVTVPASCRPTDEFTPAPASKCTPLDPSLIWSCDDSLAAAEGPSSLQSGTTTSTLALEEYATIELLPGPSVLDPLKKRHLRRKLFMMTLRPSLRTVELIAPDIQPRTWCELHGKAFTRFGGVPKSISIGALIRRLPRSTFFRPDKNPLYRDLLAHYGTSIRMEPDTGGPPARRKRPLCKYKLEFESLRAAQDFLDQDRPIEATVRTASNCALLPLPRIPFEYYDYSRHDVHIDGCVMVEESYYSVPQEWVARKVEVKLYRKSVEILDPLDGTVLRSHVRTRPRKYEIHAEDRFQSPPKSVQNLLERCRQIGYWTGKLCGRWYNRDGQSAIRKLQGLQALARRHGAQQLEEICETMAKRNLYQYGLIIDYLKKCTANRSTRQMKPRQEELCGSDQHPRHGDSLPALELAEQLPDWALD